MLDFLKKQWNLLTALSAWIATVIGGFWREPLATTPHTTTQLGLFGQFFLTLSVGLIAIPAYRFRQRRHTQRWVMVAVTLVLLTPVAYFLYDWFAATWTCPYAGTRVIVGSDTALTAHAKEYKANNPDLTCDQIVWNHAGNVEEIWTKESIETRRLILGFLYVVLLPLFAGSMISVIQAFYCGTRSR